jgi:hypothetical protein
MEEPTGTAPENAGVVDSNQAVDEKVFTQSQVDQIVADRLSREKSKLDKQLSDAAEKARVDSLSESEKLIEQAKIDARNEVKKQYAEDLAAAGIRVALAGLVTEPNEVIEDLNLSRFISDDYSVNEEAVKSLKTKYESLLGDKKRPNTTSFSPGKSTKQPEKSKTSTQRMLERFHNGR